MEAIKIESKKAPAAIGPYSQAVRVGDMLFLSGMLPINPQTGEMVGSTAAEQAEQIFKNIAALLEDVGSSINNVVKSTVFIKDIAEFGPVNEVYAKAFKDAKVLPARSLFQVAALPKAALLEVETIAIIK